ncbi:MAG: ATP-binding cassette domain-containing protein [Albidovulum sp.]|nr:ATP-binding cassette domain-containing protein [Albidovulum sp.]
MRGRELERRVGEMLEITGLSDRAKEPVKKLSGGMKRRLNFGCGFVHRPRVLLLEEPTVGVDRQSRAKLLHMMRDQARAETCVLSTAHYIEEAQELCDRLAIMDYGQILAAGTLEELRGLLGERDLLRLTGEFEPERTRNGIEVLNDAEVVSIDSGTMLVAAGAASRRLPTFFEAVANAGDRVDEATLNRPEPRRSASFPGLSARPGSGRARMPPPASSSPGCSGPPEFPPPSAVARGRHCRFGACHSLAGLRQFSRGVHRLLIP